MATRQSGPRRRPAPPHIQRKAKKAGAGQRPRPPAPKRRKGK